MELKKFRLLNNLTQNEIEKRIELTEHSYSGYETEKIKISINNLIKLADLYQISLDSLCGHSTENMLDLSNKTNEFKLLIKILQNFNNAKITMLIGYATRIAQE